MPRQRINRQRSSYFRKLGIGRNQPRAAFDGEFGGEGIRVAQAVPLPHGGSPGGSFPIHPDGRDGHLLQPGFGFPRLSFVVISGLNTPIDYR